MCEHAEYTIYAVSAHLQSAVLQEVRICSICKRAEYVIYAVSAHLQYVVLQKMRA